MKILQAFKYMKFLFACIGLIAVSASAADLPTNWNTVRKYDEMRGTPTIKLYLAAAGGALLAANAELTFTKRPVLYCQPNTLTLNFDNYVSIFEKAREKQISLFEFSKDQSLLDTPVEMVLLSGLIETFPCK